MNEDDTEFSLDSLANSLLGKEEEIIENEKATEESSENAKESTADDKESTDDKNEDESTEDKKDDESTESESESDASDKAEDKVAEEDNKPLTREDIKAALREEQDAREAATQERQTYAGQLRSELREALKLDSTYTTITLEDGTPITSVNQLTQVINPETDEPYTRDEAAQLLLDARQIVDDNLRSVEERVDALTDLNLNFKEEADEVDRLYGDILKAFPDVAKDLLEAYQKTFKVSADGNYVEEVTVSPLEFYGPALRPFRNATDQLKQQQADEAAAAAKAAQEAATKAQQEDRGDLGGTAGSAQGKPDLLDSALNKYMQDNVGE